MLTEKSRDASKGHNSLNGDITIPIDPPGSSSLSRKKPQPQITFETVEMDTKKLLFYTLGIFVCYSVYGLVQESIMKANYYTPDNPVPEKFTYALSLVFFQCIFNALVANFAIMYMDRDTDTTPRTMYILCSLSYIGAMFSSNRALQYVAYPTQVLGKSAKPIPVLILGVLLARKRYPLVKYIFITLIVVGVAMFMYKDQKGKSLDSDHTLGWGEMLLVISLLLDGVTGAIQDRMRSEHSIKSYNLMFNLNMWSTVWLATGLFGSGEIWQFIDFASRHPSILINMTLFGITSALGQVFIFMTIATFGPLTCSIATTTRKFFTILVSVFLFGHPMVMRQWFGTVFVFGGLFLDQRYGKEIKKMPKFNKSSTNLQNEQKKMTGVLHPELVNQ